MYNLIELTLHDDRIVYVMPSSISQLADLGDSTCVNLISEHALSVKQSPKEIKKRIDQSRLIHSDLYEEPVFKNLAELTQQQLDQLSEDFVGEGDRYANFKTLWGNFISQRPDMTAVVQLLTQLEDWGYETEEIV
ncbi:hypothetical protein [Spirosoma oryzicola]|uniref:hypothetical protein n=1 Tax=Spirosoma oryzicola TaxID=2898794 RepID=UPI001E45B914|nr:hypothetical protein [Spirosoma oryzicola]UHG93453.1 hypothetical protein LQ777_11225 [Spirosoma oryzicola]